MKTNCNSFTVKQIKQSTEYKSLKFKGKAKLKKKALCNEIEKINKSIPKISIKKKSIKKTKKKIIKRKSIKKSIQPKIEIEKHTPIKKLILQKFGEIGNTYKLLGDTYRSKSYMKASDIIFMLEDIPTTLSELLKIKGIGKGIAGKIIEIQKTGELKKLKELYEGDDTKALLFISSIPGFGPASAKKLIKQNIKTLEDIREKYHNQTLKLTTQQKFGALYYEDLQIKIPRNEIVIFEKQLKKIVKNIDKNLQTDIVGSYRRKKKKSGDIDILLSHRNIMSKGEIRDNYIEMIVNELKENFQYIGTLSHGKTKFMGLFIIDKLVRHIDILFIPMENFATTILYFTGSKEFNVKMRVHAKKLGYKLNEFGLYNGTKKIIVQTEREVFDFLNFPYKKPENRI